jgi:toxin HigB-1
MKASRSESVNIRRLRLVPEPTSWGCKQRLTPVSRCDTRMPLIRSFKGEWAEAILRGHRVGKGVPADISRVARRKLVLLDEAEALGDLAGLPGNRLEALRGNLAGKHSIRINDQWRVVFRWTDEGPEEVEIMDYH